MDNKKQKLIEYYSNILIAIENEDYKSIDELSNETIVRDNNRNLRKYMRILKEEALRNIFSGFIEAVMTERIDEFSKDKGYENKEQLEKDMIIFYNNWATAEEKKKYTAIKALIKDIESGNQQPFRYITEIKRLLSHNENDCFECYYQSGITVATLQKWVSRYIVICNVSEEEENKLENVLKEYSEFRKEKSRKNSKVIHNQPIGRKQENMRTEIFPKSKELLEFLISTRNSKETFCKLFGVSLKDIKKSLEIIKQCDENLYYSYIKQIDAAELDESRYNADLALMMEKIVESGIDEQDYIREFDIVDYYMVTKTEPGYFIKSASKSLKQESQILNLRTILAKSYNAIDELPFSVEQELKTQSGVLINGEERLITKEEKQGFIDYLKDNNIPVTNCTYKTMKRRFINRLTRKNIKIKTYS